ncbi:MAG: 6-bladed beta-propeller [Tangfeifania sp.]
MKNRLKILVALIVVGFGCSQKEHKPEDFKKIVLKKDENVEVLSRFVSDLEYIELQYPADSLIGPIENLKLLGDDLIIKQRIAGDLSYLRFSEEGRFLNEFGPGSEAVSLQNPRDILKYDNKFAVWDDAGVHALSESGNYIGKIVDTQHTGNSFFYSRDNFYLFHESNGPGYLSKYSINGKLSEVYKAGNRQADNLNYSRVPEMAKDSFHLFSPVNDTVFAFSQGQLSPGYLIEGESYPTLSNTLKKINELDELDKLKYLQNNKHWVIKRYLENPDFIFVVYRLASDPHYLIIRKSDWKTTYFGRAINDIDGGIWDYPMYLSDDNELYIPLGTYQIAGHKMQNKKRFDFEKVIERNLENPGPVIMKCKLK